MYTDTNSKQYFNHSCLDDYCQCLIENHCTRLDLFKRIEQEFSINSFLGFELFKRIACTYRYVLKAIVRFQPLLINNNNQWSTANVNTSLTMIIVNDNSLEIIRKPDDHKSNLLLTDIRLRFEHPCQYLCLDSRILQQAYRPNRIRFRAWIMFDEIISGVQSSSSSSFVRMNGQTLWHMIDIDENWKMSDQLMSMLKNEGSLQCH